MNHNPFCSINSNFYDESFRSTAPTTLNGENVVLSQEQQRRVCDTVNTSIVGFSGNQPMLCAQKQLVPGGVLFTFPASANAAQGPYFRCSMYQPQVQPPPQAVVSSFFPSSVEYSQLNPCGFQQPQKTFNLQFHRNSSTSSSDLPTYFPKVPAPKEFISSTPKSCQQCHTMQQLMFPSPPIDFSSRVKKLVLCKTAGPPTGHVVDVLDPNADEKKKVSFSEGQEQATKEEGIQMTSECICDTKRCKRQSKKSKGKARSQNQSDSSSVGTPSTGQSSEEETKPKKKRRKNRKKKGDKEEQSSQDELAQSKRTKSKHKLKKGLSNELGSGLSSEELSVMTSSSNTSTGSDDCQCL
ncbi:uncharacterized protein LOC109539526 isoform X1 [Dendroctonus ponderosae]|uniref:Uncharacterized protein n=1 Tax=Dendroctonus ponderosae TaxID=77166 RepID=A0AAR5PPB9_DENPD|nr:uncharacterized protein LOC109539526 isoform X1 [Dendroctonus ponderosae]